MYTGRDGDKVVEVAWGGATAGHFRTSHISTMQCLTKGNIEQIFMLRQCVLRAYVQRLGIRVLGRFWNYARQDRAARTELEPPTRLLASWGYERVTEGDGCWLGRGVWK
jgi:hypothetical protein